MKRVLLFSLLIFMLAVSITWGDTPKTMSYQGVLTDNGAVVSDGNYELTFSLYDAATGGNKVWTETQSVVVVNGIFNVILGSDTPLDIVFDEQYWLGVAVGGGAELTPRTQLTSSPYSLSGWSLTGNAGTSPPTNFLGTTDDTPLELWVNGLRAFRLEPHASSPNLIGGYSGNSVTPDVYGATICGGGTGGGASNRITDNYGVVAGGYQNQSGDDEGTTDDAHHAAVGGGAWNVAGASFATVGGGQINHATGGSSTVAGGGGNVASGAAAIVPGGWHNTADGAYSFAAGRRAKANHDGSFVWGDSTDADIESAGNDQFIVRAKGGVRFYTNSGLTSGVKLPAGASAIDTVSDSPLELWVNGLRAFRLEPNIASPNLIGGCSGNIVAEGVVGATIAGGGTTYATSAGYNSVTANYGTVGGGSRNTVSGGYSTVGGGLNNAASWLCSTVGGGQSNTASGKDSTVGGGCLNTASGLCSVIAGGCNNSVSGADAAVIGGSNNIAEGDYSVALGKNASALHTGSFVWSDPSSDNGVSSTGENQFLIRACGGTRLYSSPDMSSGVLLSAGSSALSTVSDRNMKNNIRPVDVKEILSQLAQIPINRWNYKTQNPGIEHIGPMAQDFYAAFGLGEDDRHISTIDPDGVALAAIQGLHEMVKEKDAENVDLQGQVDDLEARLAALEALVLSQKGGQK